ncbi:MAG: hypothetical protein WCB94_04565, partial [Terriglobales bacterium]
VTLPPLFADAAFGAACSTVAINASKTLSANSLSYRAGAIGSTGSLFQYEMSLKEATVSNTR